MKRRQFFSTIGAAAALPVIAGSAKQAMASPPCVAHGDHVEGGPLPFWWQDYLLNKSRSPGLLAYQTGHYLDFFGTDAPIVSEICGIAVGSIRIAQGGPKIKVCGIPVFFRRGEGGVQIPCSAAMRWAEFLEDLRQAGHPVSVALETQCDGDGFLRCAIKMEGTPEGGWRGVRI
jgi:hypothetical protein